MRRALAQLGGAGFQDGTRPTEQTDMLIPTMPDTVKANGIQLAKVADLVDATSATGRPSTEQRITPHIDGFARNRGPGLGLMLGATTYLYPVEKDGGAFCFWPRTHLPTYHFFAQHPEEIEDGASFDKIFGDAAGGLEPHEFTGNAGDAVLWHNFTFHSGSSESPRPTRHPHSNFWIRFGSDPLFRLPIQRTIVALHGWRCSRAGTTRT